MRFNNEKIFSIREYSEGNGFVITVDLEKFYLKNTTGSYHLIAARLLGLSYANYLRLLRDCFEAKIIGKNHKYPIAIFDKEYKAAEVVKLLNTIARNVKFQRENPEFNNHVDRLKEEMPEYMENFDKNFDIKSEDLKW